MVKKLEDYEWICPEPFTNLKTNPNGLMVPCCVTNLVHYKSGLFTEDDAMHVSKHGMRDFRNSRYMKIFRKAIKENDKSILNETCKTCVRQEQAGEKSPRQFYLSRFDNDFKDKKSELERIIETEDYPTFLHSVELNSFLGNLCNNSCNTCDSEFSSKYMSESIKLGEIKKQKSLIRSEHSFNFLEDLDNIQDNILEFKFTGGEPLLGNVNYDIMKKLNKSTIIRIITNGTQNPSRLINTLKGFKKVIINVSAEGVKDVSNYLRYPTDFDVVLKHYDMMQKVWGENVMFTTTINALNIARIPELLKLRKGHAGSFVSNNEYSINSVPPDIKDIYLNKLYEEGHTELINYLENATYNEEEMWKMLRHVKRRDRIRGTNLLDVFPEWKEYYETCNG